MPTEIERTLKIIKESQAVFKDTTPYLYELPGTDWKYLHISGCAARSTMQWLKHEYEGYKRLDAEQIKENTSPVFCLVAEPEYRWWNGVIEWSTNFGNYAWFKNEWIMEQWPHFDRFTLNISTLIKQVKVTKMIKVTPNLNISMQNFARENNLRMYGTFPYVKPRHRTVPYIKEMASVLKPTLTKLMNSKPELRQKLNDYIAPDYHYYDRAE